VGDEQRVDARRGERRTEPGGATGDVHHGKRIDLTTLF